MWSEGIISSPTTGNKYKYWCKHYEEDSEYGIDGGKVSKLTIRKLGESRDVLNYDRGWNVHCPNEYEAQAIYAIIYEKYN